MACLSRVTVENNYHHFTKGPLLRFIIHCCSVWTGPQTYTCTIDMNLVGMVIITISEVTVAFLGGEIINLIQKHLMYLISFNVTLQLMQLLVSRFFSVKSLSSKDDSGA